MHYVKSYYWGRASPDHAHIDSALSWAQHVSRSCRTFYFPIFWLASVITHLKNRSCCVETLLVMRLSLVLSLSLLLSFSRTHAQPFSQGADFFNSDSPLDEVTLATVNIFETTPSRQNSQDLPISPDDDQMDFLNGLEDEYSLDAANAGSEVMSLDIPALSVADHGPLGSVCILKSVEPAVKARQIIFPEWFSIPDWLPWPSKDDTVPGSDICIPKIPEEPRCEPGEETLCCKGERNWIDDSMVVVVNGCARCITPAISIFR